MKLRYHHSKPLLGIFLSLLLLVSVALAQAPTDVQIIQQAPWQIRTVKRGIVLKQAQFPRLFGAPQNISVLEIDLKNKKFYLGVAAHPKKRILTSDFARYGNALAAINGTFFNMKEGGSHMMVKVDDFVVNPTVEHSERSNGAITIEAGKIAIVPGNPENKQWDAQLSAPNVMVSGPLLITNNQPAPLSQAKFNTATHPRSAVGLTADNKLLFVTVDGRQEKSLGVSLFSLTTLLQTLGATDALNLDGGGSTTLYVKGVTENGIVNSPSDKESERTVANALLILAK